MKATMKLPACVPMLPLPRERQHGNAGSPEGAPSKPARSDSRYKSMRSGAFGCVGETHSGGAKAPILYKGLESAFASVWRRKADLTDDGPITRFITPSIGALLLKSTDVIDTRKVYSSQQERANTSKNPSGEPKLACPRHTCTDAAPHNVARSCGLLAREQRLRTPLKRRVGPERSASLPHFTGSPRSHGLEAHRNVASDKPTIFGHPAACRDLDPHTDDSLACAGRTYT